MSDGEKQEFPIYHDMVGRDFEIIVTQEFLDILNKAGSTLLPLDYGVGDVVVCRVFTQTKVG